MRSRQVTAEHADIPRSGALRAFLLITLCLAVSAGCTRSVRAALEVIHSLPDRPERTSYAFVDQKRGPETAICRSAIRTALQRHRYRETDMASATQLVSYRYSMLQGRETDAGSLTERIAARESRLELRVFIHEKSRITGKAGETLYEGAILSSGEAGEMETAVPAMIEELFEGFPGPSGQKRIVHIRLAR